MKIGAVILNQVPVIKIFTSPSNDKKRVKKGPEVF
jgi:hypothetical protein